MLDLMRKKSQSWIVKSLFVVIILVFVFFFGYTQLSKDQGKHADTIAMVNTIPIMKGEFNLSYERMTDLYKQIYPNGVPANTTKMIEQSALSQLVNEKLLADYAHKNNIEISDEELYQKISAIPAFQQNGQFDPLYYKNTFLPYFKQRNGINFEKALKYELAADKVQEMLRKNIVITPDEAQRPLNLNTVNGKFEWSKLHVTPLQKKKWL